MGTIWCTFISHTHTFPIITSMLFLSQCLSSAVQRAFDAMRWGVGQKGSSICTSYGAHKHVTLLFVGVDVCVRRRTLLFKENPKNGRRKMVSRAPRSLPTSWMPFQQPPFYWVVCFSLNIVFMIHTYTNATGSLVWWKCTTGLRVLWETYFHFD